MSYPQQPETKGAPPPEYSSGPPPPPPGYGAPPGYSGFQPPVYGQPQPMYTPMQVGMRFGEHPVNFKCPFCAADIITTTKCKVGLITWVAAGAICAIGAALGGITWLGCCLIPCCVDSLKDVEHECPNCSRVVGKYDRMK